MEMEEKVFFRYECLACGKIICHTSKRDDFNCPDCEAIENITGSIGKRFKAVETELSYLIKRFENIEKRIDGLEADIIRFVQEEKAKIIAYIKEKIND